MPISSTLHTANYYARMAVGFASYQLCRRPADPVAPVREQMLHREERFLQMAKHVLDNPKNLYRTLFDFAGCTYRDLEVAVRQKGIRKALDELLDAGVYVRHSEFRGREPLVRGGREIPWKLSDLDSPWGRGIVEHSTSGSTGASYKSTVGNASYVQREGYEALAFREFGFASRPRVLVSSILPSVWPLRAMIAWHHLGSPAQRWFALGVSASKAWHYKMASRFLVAQARVLGKKIPFPEFLPENDFAPVALYLAELKRKGRPAVVRSTVSPATRVAAAALERGLDISGTQFIVSGEPLSDAKRAVMESTGSTVFPQYHSVEFGTIGYACRQMSKGNCVHLVQDALMLLTRPREEPGQNALYATNLAPHSPRILINVEVDDSAVIEPATCDCEFSRVGFDLQVRDIFSYGKVTGQGITLEAMDLIRLLEVDLPARFGGSPGDYQLAEREGSAQTEVLLRISRRTGVESAAVVQEFFLDQMARLYGGHLSVRMWKFTGGLHAAIEEPEIGLNGKVHPLRFIGSGRRSAAAEVAAQ
ncbi:MAG: hypothetical protein ABI972_04730 [Acidobacteriota bacterium]